MNEIEQKIWEKGLDLLSRRSHSAKELKEKLQQRFPEHKNEIIKTLEEMARVELLNDRRFTEQFLHHITAKPIGKMKIMIEARRRGLDAETVENLLANAQWSEAKSAQKALQEKERTLDEKNPRKRKQKLMNFLRSRGFKDATIYKIVK